MFPEGRSIGTGYKTLGSKEGDPEKRNVLFGQS